MFKANRKYQTAQKIKFFIKDFSKCEEITEEILNGKVHFLCIQNELNIIFSMYLLAGNALFKVE